MGFSKRVFQGRKHCRPHIGVDDLKIKDRSQVNRLLDSTAPEDNIWM